jgi:DNA-binding NarL/FixJ family response regulator
MQKKINLKMINIIIADDHPIIRYGLKQIISDEDDMKITGEAETGMKVLELLKQNEYDILILDINLPDINGMEVLNKIKHSRYNLPVLILSVLPEEQYAIRMIETGASGYLNKMAVSDELIFAIRKVVEGGYYIKPSLSENMMSILNNDRRKILHNSLTKREFEIMCMLASGKPIRGIAEKLLLGVPTIYTYRTKILEKMNFKNDSELIQYCVKENLLIQ